jgi:hypothetical protein
MLFHYYVVNKINLFISRSQRIFQQADNGH